MRKTGKRFSRLMIGSMMVFSFFLVGFESKTPLNIISKPANPTPAKNNNAFPVKAGRIEMMMGTATTGGFTYIWGGAAAAILNKHIPTINVTAQITTGGSENIVRIISGEMPMGIAGSNVVQKFYDGEPENNIKASKNLRTLWASKSTVFSVIVPKNSPYKTLEDLKGKKVSIGNKGGSASESIATFLEVLGMGDKYFNLQYLTMDESLSAMKTKTIDAFATNTSDPHTAMTEVFQMPGGARFLSLPKDKIDMLLRNIPYLSPAIRKAGTYKGQEADVVSVGSPYVLVALESMPDDIAYQIAKTLDENYDDWVSIARNVEGSTLEQTVNSAYAPLHSGVAKYAREKGLLK